MSVIQVRRIRKEEYQLAWAHMNERVRFCDYYSFMSYADFTAWVATDDESLPEISFSETSLRG